MLFLYHYLFDYNHWRLLWLKGKSQKKTKYFFSKKFLSKILGYSIVIPIIMFFVFLGLYAGLGIASSIVGVCYHKLGLTFSDNFYIHIYEVVSFPFWVVFHPNKMMFQYHNDNTIHIITSVIDYKIIDLDNFDPLTFTLENRRPIQYTSQCFNILKEVINELG